MKLLHTSDWHVGKTLKGLARIDEQRVVLNGIVELAGREAVDAVLVAGDIFESAVAPPEAHELAWGTLLALKNTGAEVIVIAGNHDNAAQFDALRPLVAAAGIHLVGRVRRPDDGAVVEISSRQGDERALVALLPFLSQRHVIKAAELVANEASQNAGTYNERVRAVIGSLCAGFSADTVNVVMAHCMVRGGRLGGGERDAQTIEDYYVDATCFPASAHYVALGHLHRSQELPSASRTWYSGSPIQIDFGEGGEAKHALFVEAHPGKPATVEQVPLEGVRRLRTIEGTLADLRKVAAEVGDDLLRVVVQESARAGLNDEVRTLLPNAIDVLIAKADTDGGTGTKHRSGRSPIELFAAYLAEQGVDDDRISGLFASLLDEDTSGEEVA